MGRTEEAEQAFRRAIEINPKYGPSYSRLGFLLLDEERWDEVRNQLETAVELSDKYAGGQRSLAWLALLQKGDVELARQWADTAHKIEPSHQGTKLTQIAVEGWSGHFETLKELGVWFGTVRMKNYETIYSYRQKLGALLGRLARQQSLQPVAAALQPMAAHHFIQPFFQGIQAWLAGQPPESLENIPARQFLQAIIKHAKPLE